jgi:RNA polymerase sigma factor for flagellar operon FliA
MPAAVTAPAASADAPGELTEPASIEELWLAYKRSGSRRLRNRLILHYMGGHVRRLAERLHAGLPRQVDVDDLIQVGYVGLAEAIDRFELERHVRFETFSARRIYGAMRDYLRSIDPVPRLARNRAKRLQEAVESFRKRNGRAPDEDELREVLQLNDSMFRKLLSEARPVSMVSYGAARPEVEPDGDTDAMMVFEDRNQPSPFHAAARNDLQRWVIRGLCRRDRLIVILYYYEHLTMKEIGAALGISESRVSQRLDSILACLRSRMTRTEILPELFVG